MDEKANSRLLLADQFFELATGGTEAAMRSSLARLYYASFHVAAVLTGGTSHGDIAKRLTDSHGEIGRNFKRLHDVRSQMDYTPDFFEKMGVTDPKIWYQERLQEGTGLYFQLRSILESDQRVKA